MAVRLIAHSVRAVTNDARERIGIAYYVLFYARAPTRANVYYNTVLFFLYEIEMTLALFMFMYKKENNPTILKSTNISHLLIYPSRNHARMEI